MHRFPFVYFKTELCKSILRSRFSPASAARRCCRGGRSGAGQVRCDNSSQPLADPAPRKQVAQFAILGVLSGVYFIVPSFLGEAFPFLARAPTSACATKPGGTAGKPRNRRRPVPRSPSRPRAACPRPGMGRGLRAPGQAEPAAGGSAAAATGRRGGTYAGGCCSRSAAARGRGARGGGKGAHHPAALLGHGSGSALPARPRRTQRNAPPNGRAGRAGGAAHLRGASQWYPAGS